MKSLKKLIPAIAMLLVSAVLLGTSTFAWFSMNSRVTVTGMTVTTTVSSNLLIAETNAEANYKTSLEQSRTAKLEPVSTTTATTFYYHATNAHVLGNGNVDDTTWALYTEAAMDGEWTTPLAVCAAAGKVNLYDAAFNTTYGNTVASDSATVYHGYVDYVFFLKATSTAADQVLKMTTCNLLYNNETVAVSEKAWRVAVLSQASAADTATAGDGSLVTILAPSGAANFVANNAVTSTSARGAVTYGTAAVIDDNVDAGDHYYKVVVRLWIEGDDTTCNVTTFQPLTNNYKLTIGFELAANATGASTVITSNLP